MRILIVDDDYGKKVEWIKEILREKNIEYEQISYFNEALRKIINSNSIDGIILDMDFPISVNSVEKKKKRMGLVLLKKMKDKNIETQTLGNSTMRFPDSNEYPFLKGQLDGYKTFDGRNTLLKFLESIEEQS